MLGDVAVQDAPTIMADDEKAIKHAESDSRNGEEIHGRNSFPVVAQKGLPAFGRSGSFGARFIQREIVRSETSKPSMRSSPWMRGAPQVGFSTTMLQINCRTSLGVCLLPTGFLILEISLQYRRQPARCHRVTVSGVTTMRACFHCGQDRLAAVQKSLSNAAISSGAGMLAFKHRELLPKRQIFEQEVPTDSGRARSIAPTNSLI